MRYVKRLIAPLCVVGVILAVVAVIVNWKEEPEVESIRTHSYGEGQKKYVLESDRLKFTLDAKTTQFQVQLKDNGDVWYSNPLDAEKDTKAVALEKDNLRSTFLLKYSTINGVDTQYNNYGYSIANGLYEIEAGDDYVKVIYSVGDLEKEYFIPKVLTEARMMELLDKMDQNGKGRVTNYYKKYDINRLGKKDDKEQLLKDYPMLATTVIYVLRENAKDTMKKSMEQIFADAGYTMEEYLQEKNAGNDEVVSEKPIFNVSVIYRLEGDDLVVEVPFEEIEYRKKYPLVSLNLLPYFGAGSTKENGYLMVPEGGGGIIRFNNGKTAQAAYYADLYGWDMAINREAVVHETSTYFNAFGIARDTSAFLCILDDGASYASIQADISGKSNSYNYASATYTIVHRDLYEVTERYNGDMYVYEKGLPKERLVQRYRFQNSGSYGEMAQHYRTYLQERYGEQFAEKPQQEAPVVLEMVGAIDKVKQVCGVPVSKPFELTTYQEALSMIDELQEHGVAGMSVKYSGFMNGGVNQKILKKTKLVSSVGNQKSLKHFLAAAQERNIDVYLNGITNYAKDSNLLDGFSVLKDAARMVTKEKVELYTYCPVTFSKQEHREPYYLLHADSIIDMMDNLDGLAEQYQTNPSFDDVGCVLSADYYKNHPVSREAARAAQTEKLKEIKESGKKVMINMGNDYALAYSDVITNMDLSGSSYTILDENVPIYQMAVHGFVTYTGTPINMSANPQEEILASVEYGAGLSYTLMGERSLKLQDSLYTKYYGAEYDSVKESLIQEYTRYNKELGHTFAQKMTGHEQLSDTLACTYYEDGTKVYVNYGYDEEKTEDGINVAARDYIVVRSGGRYEE